MEKKGLVVKRLQSWLSHLVKKKKLVLLCGVLGLTLMIIPDLFSKNSQSEQSESFSTQAYIQRVEQQLVSIISSIQGAGKCKVMLTLENGVEYVYATEQKSNSDRQEQTGTDENRLTQRNDNETAAVIVENGNKREGLLVTELQPTIRGVVVVCEGGDHDEIRDQISQAVTVALNISSKRVYVTKLA